MNKRKRIVIVAVTVAAAGVVLAWWLAGQRSPEDGELTLYGNIDIREVRLAFNDSERIVSLAAHEGDRVTAGQELGRLDTERLQAQVDYAAAQVAAQQQVVAKLVAGSRPQEIRKAAADVAAAAAEAHLAALHYQRAARLFAQNAVSRQDRDDARAASQAAGARLDAAQQALKLLQIGPRTEDIAAAKHSLDATKAQLALARRALADATLKAPAAGIVENRILEPGDMASPQTPAYTLALTGEMWVRAWVDEPDLGRVQPGMAAWVTSDTRPGKRYPAVVGYVSPVAEFTPKSVETPEVRTALVYQVRVNICGSTEGLRLGMPTTVTLSTGAPDASCGRR